MRPPFTCLYREIWDDRRVYEMSEIGRLVYMFVLSAPTGNGLGCFKAGMASMIEDARLPSERFIEGFNEGLAKQCFNYDSDARVVLIPKYLRRNPPSNPNGIIALGREFLKIPNCQLKVECYRDVEDFVKTRKESFVEAFDQWFNEPIVEHPRLKTPSPSPSPSPSYSLSSAKPVPGTLPHSGPTKKSGAKKSKTKSKGGETWKAYSLAFRERYGTDPVRNARSNTLCSKLVDLLSGKDAPYVAYFYVTLATNPYLSSGHSLALLVRDAEKIDMQWRTNRQISQSKSAEADRLTGEADGWNKIISERGES